MFWCVILVMAQDFELVWSWDNDVHGEMFAVWIRVEGGGMLNVFDLNTFELGL